MPIALVDDAQRDARRSSEVEAEGHDVSPITTPAYNEAGSNEVDGDDDDDDDWLMDDADQVQAPQVNGNLNINGHAGEEADSHGHPLDMTSRDSAKVQRVFYDTGYREGITSGKLSALQSGFDEGFNQAAPLGRARGFMRGQVLALMHWNMVNDARDEDEYDIGGSSSSSRSNGTSASSSSSQGRQARSAARAGKMARGGMRKLRGTANGAPHLPNVDENEGSSSSPRSRSPASSSDTNLRSLLKEVDSLNVDMLLGPDWEARRHAMEDSGGGMDDAGEEERVSLAKARQKRDELPDLKERVERLVRQSCGLEEADRDAQVA